MHDDVNEAARSTLHRLMTEVGTEDRSRCPLHRTDACCAVSRGEALDGFPQPEGLDLFVSHDALFLSRAAQRVGGTSLEYIRILLSRNVTRSFTLPQESRQGYVRPPPINSLPPCIPYTLS
jgi:hypothetical protein